MITKKYRICADILNLVMILLLCTILCHMAAVSVSYEFDVTVVYGLAVLLTILYLARLHVKNLFLFIGLHLILTAVLFVLPLPLFVQVELIVFTVILSIADFAFWADRTLHGFFYVHLAWCVIFLAAYLYGSYKQTVNLQDASYVMGILFFGIYFLRLYFENGMHFSMDKQMNEEVPVRQMYTQNIKMILPLVMVFVAGMFLLQSKVLAQFLMVILRTIFNAVVYFVNWLSSLFPDAGTVTQEAAELPEDFFEKGGASAGWLQALIRIIELIISTAVLLVFLFFSVRGICRFIRKNLHRKEIEAQMLEYQDMKEKRERIVRENMKKKKRLFEKATNAEKIRRMYRKKIRILTRTGYQVNEADTPMERAEDIFLCKGEDIAEATCIYEEARYGKEAVSDESVRRMKEASYR
ncbi:MAG TPA: DUF4129 domain-containing protein [Lachnospiraceae bacterium]|nr:DUF4129 domain-containing protein [Lachnospiraceae bacterium]